jgi:hypothetical protein
MYYYKVNKSLLSLKSELIPLPEGYKKLTQEEYEQELKKANEKTSFKKQEQSEASKKLNELKSKLCSSDYKAIKFAEGLYTEEEYAPIRKQREDIRKEIRKLEAQLDKETNGK